MVQKIGALSGALFWGPFFRIEGDTKSAWARQGILLLSVSLSHTRTIGHLCHSCVTHRGSGIARRAYTYTLSVMISHGLFMLMLIQVPLLFSGQISIHRWIYLLLFTSFSTWVHLEKEACSIRQLYGIPLTRCCKMGDLKTRQTGFRYWCFVLWLFLIRAVTYTYELLELQFYLGFDRYVVVGHEKES